MRLEGRGDKLTGACILRFTLPFKLCSLSRELFFEVFELKVLSRYEVSCLFFHISPQSCSLVQFEDILFELKHQLVAKLLPCLLELTLGITFNLLKLHFQVLDNGEVFLRKELASEPPELS